MENENVKFIYNRYTDLLLAITDSFYIGDIDVRKQQTAEQKIVEILAQDRKLKDEVDKFASVAVYVYVVWLCYVMDNYGNPIMVKVVSEEHQANEWLMGAPTKRGQISEDRETGNRYVEAHFVERPAR